MCGRFSLVDPPKIEDRFHLTLEDIAFTPRYNIAPMQYSPVISSHDKSRISLMRWGLVPRWAKDESMGSRMINARGETISEKPSFREPLKRQRCLVIADGFYEWRKETKQKQKTPVHFVLKDHHLFGFAGLWDIWKKPDGGDLYSFTIITTDANSLVKNIHDRMPVILDRNMEGEWLADKDIDGKLLGQIIKPFPSDMMECYEVSRIVNSPSVDTPECVKPLNI